MEADYVVVGAGPAGSVIAAALAAPGRTVALIEEGERREHLFARVPAAALIAPARRAATRRFVAETDPTAAGRRLTWVTPRGLCASQALTGLVYARGFARDYDEWADAGAQGWSYADVAPVFRSLEQAPGLVAGTPLSLATTDSASPVTRAFLESCTTLGLECVTGRESPERPHARTAELILRGGRRATPADLWLKPQLRNSALVLLTRTKALALQLDGRRCIGVFARRNGQDLQVRARAEVILAAGVFGSPKLLMVSGIGPPGLLASAGVTPRHPLPGVGGNLADHVGVGVAFAARHGSLTRRDGELPLALVHFLRWAARRGGPFATPPIAASAWAGTGGRADYALLLTPATLLAATSGYQLAARPGITLTVHARRSRARGRLRLAGPGADDPLAVEHPILSDREEPPLLGEAVRFARRLCATAPFAALLDGELEPGTAIAGDAELTAAIRAQARPLGHATGTCRIGDVRDADAVVDARLRVHGVQGLRIVDASVMPRVPSDGPGAAAIMVAARAASFIREGG